MKYEYKPVSSDPNDIWQISWMPHVPVTISGLHKSRKVAALIDSGAALCVADMGYAKAIGVKPDRKSGITIRGATGTKDTTVVYPATIGLQLDGLDRVELPVYFGNTDTSALILGQRDFFDRFNVNFKKSEYKFEITPLKRQRD